MSSSQRTSLISSLKLPLREEGVSSLTPFRSFTDLQAATAAALSSSKVSMSMMRGTLGSMISSKALKAASLLPMVSMSAWGTVPTASVPQMSAPKVEDTPSQPPMKQDLSSTPAIPGCILRFPNAKTVLPLAAHLTLAEEVATPEGWQIIPSMAVS